MTPFILIGLVALLFIYGISPLYIINPNDVLASRGNQYLFVRWNWYCVNGMTGHNLDVYVRKIKVCGIFAWDMSGAFNDNSDGYILPCGKGIRPPDSMFL